MGKRTIDVFDSERTIRLGCYDCDRSDYEFNAREHLAAAIEAGWKDVVEIQSFAKSIDEDPTRGNLLDWETHRGLCPRCRQEHIDEP